MIRFSQNGNYIVSSQGDVWSRSGDDFNHRGSFNMAGFTSLFGFTNPAISNDGNFISLQEDGTVSAIKLAEWNGSAYVEVFDVTAIHAVSSWKCVSHFGLDNRTFYTDSICLYAYILPSFFIDYSVICKRLGTMHVLLKLYIIVTTVGGACI